MFGEGNTPSSIGPSRHGLWVGFAVVCLLLATAAALVSGTANGLNFFGARLPDTTPTFSDPPKDDDPTDVKIPQHPPGPQMSARSVAPARPAPPPPVPHAAPVNRERAMAEGRALYTQAVDKQQESLTAALDLARQAQRAVADDAIGRRQSAGARPDAPDVTVLGSLRASISALISAMEKRREYLQQQYDDIQRAVQRKQLAGANAALDRLPADAPTADPAFPFTTLRADLERTIALAETYRKQAAAASALGLESDAITLYRRAQAIDPAGADYDALVGEARERAAVIIAKRKELRSLLNNRRLSAAAREVAALGRQFPADTVQYQFKELKSEFLDLQQELAGLIKAAEDAMGSHLYATAERLWRAAATLDRDQSFEDRIRRAIFLARGRW